MDVWYNTYYCVDVFLCLDSQLASPEGMHVSRLDLRYTGHKLRREAAALCARKDYRMAVQLLVDTSYRYVK